MAYTINSAQIFSFSEKAEKFNSTFKKLNLVIGEESEEILNIIALATCGAMFNSERDIMANLKINAYEKEYFASMFYSDTRTESLVTYLDNNQVFSTDAFVEYDSLRTRFAFNTSNIFKNEKKTIMDEGLSDAQISMINFREFMDLLKKDTDKGDVRPIFISGFFEKIASNDKKDVITELDNLDRQVFIAAGNDVFPIKLEMNKIYLN